MDQVALWDALRAKDVEKIIQISNKTSDFLLSENPDNYREWAVDYCLMNDMEELVENCIFGYYHGFPGCLPIIEGIMYHACMRNQEKTLLYVLSIKGGLDINFQMTDKIKPPLVVACEFGSFEVVNLLLKDPRIDINCTFNERCLDSALTSACKSKREDIVKLLLTQTDLKLNYKNYNRKTALHLACQFDYLEIVKLLLDDKRAEFEVLDDNGRTPFFLACSQGSISVFNLFLNDVRLKHIDLNMPDNSGHTPFCVACKNGQDNIVRAALQVKERFFLNKANDIGQSPLFLASECGHLKIVQLLVDEPEVTYYSEDENRGYYSLHCACDRGYLEIVTTLCQRKQCRETANCVGQGGVNAWENALISGRVDIIKYFMETDFVDISSTYHLGTACTRIGEYFQDLVEFICLNNKVIFPKLQYLETGFGWKDAKYYNPNGFKYMKNFLENPIACRNKAGRKYQVDLEIFTMIVLICDGYLQVKEPSDSNSDNVLRFIKMMKLLPLNIQILVCKNIYQTKGEYYPSNLVEKALKSVLLKFESGWK